MNYENDDTISDKLLKLVDHEIYQQFQQQKQIQWQQDRDTQLTIRQQLKGVVILEDDDQTVSETFQNNLNDCELAEESQQNIIQQVNITFEYSTKQQSVNQLTNSSQLLNSQQSTQDVALNFKNEDDEKYGTIESDNSNKLPPGQYFSKHFPPIQPSEIGNESCSVNVAQQSIQDVTPKKSSLDQCPNESQTKEQLNQGQPSIDLKNAIQPFCCLCEKVKYNRSSSLTNHIRRMATKVDDSDQHGRKPRDVLEGRPMKLTQYYKNLIKKIWKKELQDKDNTEQQIRYIVEQFQVHINKISQKDAAIIHQLKIEKMQLRQFFIKLPINDADSFIQKFVDYRKLKGVKSALMRRRKLMADKEGAAFNSKLSTQQLAQENLIASSL